MWVQAVEITTAVGIGVAVLTWNKRATACLFVYAAQAVGLTLIVRLEPHPVLRFIVAMTSFMTATLIHFIAVVFHAAHDRRCRPVRVASGASACTRPSAFPAAKWPQG